MIDNLLSWLQSHASIFWLEEGDGERIDLAEREARGINGGHGVCYISTMESNFVLSDAQKRALQKLGVVLCYLHGSIAEGTARKDSDVDVAVLFDKMPEDPISITGTLIDILAGFIPGRELDIAILNEASPLLRQIVASTGKLLYARSPDDTLRFELRAMHEYEYSKHIVRLGQELVLQRAGL